MEDLRESMLIRMLSYIFSMVTIMSSFTLKVPQIQTMLNRKSAEGLTVSAMMLEITGYSITALYSYSNGYSLWTYFEYPVILLQLYIMLYFTLKFKNLWNELLVTLGVLTYVAVVFGFATNTIPYNVLATMFPMCTPLSFVAKFSYMYGIYKLGNSDSVSLTTWVISICTNLMRAFTVYVDSADTLIMANLTLSAAMSGAVLLTAMYYRRFSRNYTQRSLRAHYD